MMKKKFLLFPALLSAALTTLNAQNYTPVEQIPEARVPFEADPAWSKMSSARFAWGSIDTRYDKYAVPEIKEGAKARQSAWRGEKVNFQAVVWTPDALQEASLAVSDLKCGRNTISAENVKAGFERYVLGDCLGVKGTKGYFDESEGGIGGYDRRDSVLVADAIVGPEMPAIEAQTVRPVWISVSIPRSAAAGTYRGSVTFSSKSLKKELKLQYSVVVKDRVLPEPSLWKFHLDLWQSPFAIARYYGVTPWSREHLELMRPYMERLAAAGEKVVTATLMHDCWGPQTLDPFATMVQVSRNIDGTYEFNYDIFDLWVDFMATCGITEQINCFTIAPWQMNFRYFDRATDSMQSLHFADYGDEAYRSIWLPLLKDFSAHLHQKGWFSKTYLAVDERGLDVMLKVIALAREADPQYKFALAGLYHPEIMDDLSDFSMDMASEEPFIADGSTQINSSRREEGKITTFYICCGEPHPNTFTFSPLTDSAALGWYTLAGNYDGMLRWAYNSWNSEPLKDGRWYNLSSGDLYMVYPQNCSSVRWERFVEGIQDFEKVQILRKEYASQPEKLAALEDAIAAFNRDALIGGGAPGMLRAAKAALNKF